MNNLADNIAAILASESINANDVENEIERLVNKAIVRRESTGTILVRELIKCALDNLEYRRVADTLLGYPQVRKAQYIGFWDKFSWLCQTTNTWM